MGIFNKKSKPEEENKPVVRSAVVDNAPKTEEIENKKELKQSSKATADKGKPVLSKTKDAKPIVPSIHRLGILIRPIVTEKSAGLAALNGYVFEVKVGTNKIEIAGAFEDKYKIKPKSVNVVNYAGKTVRFGRRVGRKRAWRKAIITLPEGKSIEVQEAT